MTHVPSRIAPRRALADIAALGAVLLQALHAPLAANGAPAVAAWIRRAAR